MTSPPNASAPPRLRAAASAWSAHAGNAASTRHDHHRPFLKILSGIGSAVRWMPANSIDAVHADQSRIVQVRQQRILPGVATVPTDLQHHAEAVKLQVSFGLRDCGDLLIAEVDDVLAVWLDGEFHLAGTAPSN